MISVLQIASLALITLFAVAAALAFNWLCLRAMFVLMRPATVRQVAPRTQLVHGITQLARVNANHQ